MKRKDGALRRILGFAAPYRAALILVVVFSLFSVAATLYVPILTGDAIDFILGPGRVDFPRIVPILLQLLAPWPWARLPSICWDCAPTAFPMAWPAIFACAP